MRPKLTRDGRALLKKALAAIKRHPDTFNMSIYLAHDESVKGKAPYCGTTACLAGHIALAAGVSPSIRTDPQISELPRRLRPLARKVRLSPDSEWVMFRDLAAALVVGPDLLAINKMAEALFYGKQRTPAQIESRVKAWLKTGR